MITPEKIEYVISVLESRQDELIHIGQASICSKYNNHPCGSPACVAGNYWLARKWDGITEYPLSSMGYSEGAKLMAKDLGFSSDIELQRWARDCLEIWGNGDGYCMFASSSAYGLSSELNEKPFPMEIVIQHWKGVLERLRHSIGYDFVEIEIGEKNDHCKAD